MNIWIKKKLKKAYKLLGNRAKALEINRDGDVSIFYSKEEVKVFVEPFKYTLIWKFFNCYPSMRALKRCFLKIRLKHSKKICIL